MIRIAKRIRMADARVLVLGLTFKENCPDLRNTRVIDVIGELANYHLVVDVHDPCANAKEAFREYALNLVAQPDSGRYDAIVLAVAHRQFVDLGVERIRAFGKPACVIFDVKGVLPADAVDDRL